MIDGTQCTAPEEFGQLVGIGLIALVPLWRLPAPIAHDDLVDHGYEQIVQPLRLCPFFERDVYRSAHSPEELDDHRRLGGKMLRAITRPL